MAAKKQEKQKKSIKISFTPVKGKPDAIFLPHDTPAEVVAFMKRAVSEYVAERKKGTPPSDDVRKKVPALLVPHFH